MIEDRRGIFARPGRTTLFALQRETERLLIGALGDGDALRSHLKPRGIHHREHLGEPLVLDADEFRMRAIVGHRAGGRAMDAELVLDARGAEIVRRAQRAVIVDEAPRA